MSLPTVAYRLIGRFSVSRFAQVVHPLPFRLTGGAGIRLYRRESPIHIPIVVLEPVDAPEPDA